MAKVIKLHKHLQINKNTRTLQREIEKAEQRFATKSFADKYRTLKTAFITFRFAFHLFSILTGISFLSSLFNQVIDWELVSLILAGLFLLFWEVAKGTILKNTFEHYYSQFSYPLYLIGFAVLMIIGSSYVSIEGAKTYYTSQDESIRLRANQLQVSKDSVRQYYKAEIQVNLDRIKSDSANRKNYYRGNLNWNLQQAHNLLLEDNINLKAQMLDDLRKVDKLSDQENTTLRNEIGFNAVLFGCLSAINELLIIMIGWFLVYYDYRLLEEKKGGVVADTSTDITQLVEVMEELEALKRMVSKSKSQSKNEAPIIAKPKCQHCGNSFERRTKWQKFCSSRCRIANHKKLRSIGTGSE